MPQKSFVVETIKRNQLVEALSKGRRLDGRGLNELRKLEIKTHVIEKANGSAMVTLGDTQVLAGVKVDKGTPFPDTPDKGLLIVGAEVLPMAAAYLEAGPPDESAIELARVVDRGVRESEMIDVASLVIKEGKWVYSVFVDVNILNADGNVFDPTEEEEAVMDARITLDTEDGGNLCAGQKGEPGYLTPEQILTAAEWSIARGKEIRQRIKEATGA